MTNEKYSIESLKKQVQKTYPDMPEYIQALEDVAEDVLAPESSDSREVLEQNWRALRYLSEPDRIINFRVAWVDDHNRRRFNRGYRVQFNNMLGPYKGGLRFNKALNTSVLCFLGFEQTFKNSLTGLPMGGAKGGSDFDPHGKSREEIQRFCEAFMTQLARHIGPDIDVPAGDIGVGSAEIAYMFDQYRAITGKFSGVLTGKHPVFGGSCFREEATGYGTVYFAEHLVKHEFDETLEDKVCAVSGAGNVALHTAEKLLSKKAKVIALSNSKGTAHFKDGLQQDMLERLKKHIGKRGDLQEFAEQQDITFKQDKKPWALHPQLAFACATQNELDENDAKELIENECLAVFEGANMPCTSAAMQSFKKSPIIVAPSKAVNAGGVAVSGLEISQNRTRLRWQADRVDKKLQEIMHTIFEACCAHGKTGENSAIDYKRGANLAAFEQLSEALRWYGTA